jgi:hypothetical protein
MFPDIRGNLRQLCVEDKRPWLIGSNVTSYYDNLRNQISADYHFNDQTTVLTSTIRNQINVIWNAFRTGGISNPQCPTDKDEVPSSQLKKLYPALTWEESMGTIEGTA